MYLHTRVTRWAIFRHSGDCLLWAVFNCKNSPNISATIFYDNIYVCINFDKTLLGCILVDCFTNSSGHPATQIQSSSAFFLSLHKDTSRCWRIHINVDTGQGPNCLFMLGVGYRCRSDTSSDDLFNFVTDCLIRLFCCVCDNTAVRWSLFE
jgi:hypothetical protein